MKKIIFVVVCLCSVKVVYAEGLLLTYLPYYVKVNDSEIIRVRKLFEVDTKEVLFNTDIFNYQLTSDTPKVNLMENFENIDYFNTIIYYGYNDSLKKNEDYFLTQALIWELFCNLDFEIVDKNGNSIEEYNQSLEEIKEKIDNHYKEDELLKSSYDMVVGESINIPDNYSLNDLVEDGLSFTKSEEGIRISADKIGSYEINFTKEYEKNNFCYSDGKNTYYASLGGPASLNKKVRINVSGVNLTIKDNYKGINNKFGDGLLESRYALFKDNELIKELNNNESIEIIPNTDYILKDISLNKTIYKKTDLLINLNSDYEINFNRVVVNKNIDIKVNDNFTYNIYLKSNNELYEVINKNIKEITLPYGVYYIVCKDIDFYDELEIYDDIPVTLKLDNNYLLEKDKNEEQKNNETEEQIKNILNSEENNEIFEGMIENPKTLDHIQMDFVTYLCCLACMGISFKKIISK